MARGGHRYPLILYSYTLNRWWKPAFWTGFLLLALAAALDQLPIWLPQYRLPHYSDAVLLIIAVAGALAVLGAIFLLILRKSAFVQAHTSHLRLVTPLLSLNISYKRIRRTTCMEMQQLFPPARLKGWRANFIRPLSWETAVVVDMAGWPMSPKLLKWFLSPFFFPDRTARLALLVSRWMDFSTELESYRGAWLEAQRNAPRSPQSDLLASLSTKKR